MQEPVPVREPVREPTPEPKPVMKERNTSIKLFGKPEVSGRRRMGVALARAESVEEAKVRAIGVAKAVKYEI